MPTNPVNPHNSAAVGRLTLGVDSPRGTEPSMIVITTCNCFEAEASAVIFGCYGTACFEAEASNIAACSCSSWCFEGE